MGVIDDVRKWLKEIPIWQELEKVPDRMTELETRMSTLEERLKTRPGETCPACGEHAMRVTFSGGRRGDGARQHRADQWTCKECGHQEDRVTYF